MNCRQGGDLLIDLFTFLPSSWNAKSCIEIFRIQQLTQVAFHCMAFAMQQWESERVSLWMRGLGWHWGGVLWGNMMCFLEAGSLQIDVNDSNFVWLDLNMILSMVCTSQANVCCCSASTWKMWSFDWRHAKHRTTRTDPLKAFRWRTDVVKWDFTIFHQHILAHSPHGFWLRTNYCTHNGVVPL